MNHPRPSAIEPCPAVILSGGLSRRMGSDKSSLALGDMTLLQRAVRTLGSVFDPVYVSVRSLPGNVPAGCVPLPDIIPGCGPMSGLHAALRAVPSGRVFLSAVDLPFITARAAALLVNCSKGYDACIIRRANGYLEPLFGVYSVRCLPAVEELISSGSFSMRSLLERCRVNYISESRIADADRLLINVNTPAELEHARAVYSDVSSH